MAVLLALASVVLLLAALAPVLMMGGEMIAAFMVRQQMGRHLAATLLVLGALLGGAFFAVPLMATGQRLLAGALLAALPWAALWVARRFILPRPAGAPNTPPDEPPQ
ncbi:hypothetical protein IP84_02640 [beta proteobacterium AAP99]|nr:hypothetical protein IP84_02640 [beta proteobacterium AAP99]